MVHEDLTPLEAVALAVRSEIESTNLYGKLTERVRNPEVKQLLLELAADEEHHRDALMKMYQNMLGSETPSVPESDGRKKEWDIDPEAEYLTIMIKILKVGMQPDGRRNTNINSSLIQIFFNDPVVRDSLRVIPIQCIPILVPAFFNGFCIGGSRGFTS